MKVDVLLFAGPREALGARRVAVEVQEPATAEDVVAALVAAHPALAPWKGRAVLAVDRAVARPTDPVRAGAEVAFLPPVSGGSGRLTEGPIHVDPLVEAAAKDGAGAVVAFLGLVRSPGPLGEVTHLDFEAYEDMAERELAAVEARARERFGLVDARIMHRVGRAAAREPVVLVVVTAPHRKEAFAAAAWIMDELKTVVPIWKKEEGPHGARWLPERSDHATESPQGRSGVSGAGREHGRSARGTSADGTEGGPG